MLANREKQHQILTGGFNGGGYSETGSFPSGGGATDVRLVKSTSVYDDNSLASRIMVAAGGSGNICCGNGLDGGSIESKTISDYNGIATQTHPGTNGTFGKPSVINGYAGSGGGYYTGGMIDENENDIYIGEEHQTVKIDGTKMIKYGANGRYSYRICTNSVSLENTVFGDPIVGTVKSGYITKFNICTGGSSYISGHNGCIAIKSAIEIEPKVTTYTNINDSIHYSGKYFTNTFMSAGDESADSSNTGNGKCIILNITNNDTKK